jgi:LacI family transcriptional regulator/LacI family repressor for deo operon, udp, cdd, tsx, nupC, and nupG
VLGICRQAGAKRVTRVKSMLGEEIGLPHALAAAGVELDEELVRRAPHGREAAAALARGLLRSAEPPTAIFAASDTQAVGVLEAADELGVDVPDDLAVVGYDDIEVARYAGLTTVAQPLEESGARGAELLLAELDGGPVTGQQLSIELVLRSTTGCKDRTREACKDGKRVRS